MLVLEDNDAVIKMTLKGRSPNMRHVARTHRVDLDWLFERFQNDPGILIRYVNTLKQIADILTKGSFTSQTWNRLCELASIGEVKGENIKQPAIESGRTPKATLAYHSPSELSVATRLEQSQTRQKPKLSSSLQPPQTELNRHYSLFCCTRPGRPGAASKAVGASTAQGDLVQTMPELPSQEVRAHCAARWTFDFRTMLRAHASLGSEP